MNSEKKRQHSFGRILYWVVGILLLLTVLTAWSVSGVYAKFVTSANIDGGTPHVANGGIKNFTVLEHEIKLATNDKGELTGKYEIDDTKTVSGNEYLLIPGVDIPKDPFIEMEIEGSEVNYALFVRVTVANLPTYTDDEKKTQYSVSFDLTENWLLIDGPKEGDGVYTYQYVKDAPADAESPEGTDAEEEEQEPAKEAVIFKAGEKVTCTGENVIKILADDTIYVSEHYVGETDTDKKFTLTFDAYLQQVLA